jgi:hypothetical protein
MLFDPTVRMAVPVSVLASIAVSIPVPISIMVPDIDMHSRNPNANIIGMGWWQCREAYRAKGDAGG